MLTPNILYVGKADLPQEPVRLRAGPLSLVYQDGEISKIFYREFEVVQRFYSRVRDQNWGTVPNRITSLTLDQDESSFNIVFQVESIQNEIDFFWEGRIRGNSSGQIEFSFNGKARSDFLTSRIGFCILHPLATCMKKTCKVTDKNGQEHTGVFPSFIAPAQIEPFVDMQAMEYEVSPGVKVRLQFIGDLFEMEDQRNWSDASYKTFCTPLRFECPRLVKAGCEISQKITLELLADRTIVHVAAPQPGKENIIVTLNQEKSKALPGIGLSTPTGRPPYTEKQIRLLKQLNLSHLRLALHFSPDRSEETIQYELEKTLITGLPLEIALYLQDTEQDTATALKLTRQLGCPVKRWLIFEEGKYISTSTDISNFRKAAGKEIAVPIGGGSDADFYELNSQPMPFELLDFVSYSLNPQVHSADNLSLIENLEAQPMTVESASHISSQKPVIISPITLKQRFNPVAISKDTNGKADELPSSVDPRQMSLFAAGWTIGSLHYLLRSPVESLTYYETVGWHGVIEEEDGCPLPDKFHSLPGSVFPVYHVFADLGEFRNGQVIETKSSDPMTIACFGIRERDRTMLLIANLTNNPETVQIDELGDQSVVRIMDERNAVTAMTDPFKFRSESFESRILGKTVQLHLHPYAVGRLITSK